MRTRVGNQTQRYGQSKPSVLRDCTHCQAQREREHSRCAQRESQAAHKDVHNKCSTEVRGSGLQDATAGPAAAGSKETMALIIQAEVHKHSKQGIVNS